MGCLGLSYYEQGLPPFAGRSVFLSTAKAAQRCPQGNEKSCAGSYKFGFNGQEKVNEIAGVGNHTTALFWEYDTRIARRWNLDPVVKPWESGYATFGGNPIRFADPLGDDFKDKKGNNVAAGEGITANSDGSRITNSTKGGNWDYGTWNEETGGYDLNYLSATGSVGQMSQSVGGVPWGDLGQLTGSYANRLESRLRYESNYPGVTGQDVEGLTGRTLGFRSLEAVLGRIGFITDMAALYHMGTGKSNGKPNDPFPVPWDAGITGLLAKNKMVEMESAIFSASVRSGFPALSNYFNNSDKYMHLGLRYGITTRNNATLYITNGVNIQEQIQTGQIQLSPKVPSSIRQSDSFNTLLIYSERDNAITNDIICAPIPVK